jgi:hypothetical protein
MGDNRWIITKQGRIDLFRRRNAGDLFDEVKSYFILGTNQIHCLFAFVYSNKTST